MLGDLGMVICASAIRPLLDEVEQRVIKAEAAVGRTLIDQVYKTKVDAALAQKWYHARAGSAQNDELVEDSIGKLRALKGRILCTIADLRRTCDSYDGVGGVLREAQAKVKALLERLGQSDTKKRSDRFQGMLVDLEQKAEPAWQVATGPARLPVGDQKPEPTLQLAFGALAQSAPEAPLAIPKEPTLQPWSVRNPAFGALAQSAPEAPPKEQASSWEPQPRQITWGAQVLTLKHDLGTIKGSSEVDTQADDHESTTASGPPSHEGSSAGEDKGEQWSWVPRFF